MTRSARAALLAGLVAACGGDKKQDGDAGAVVVAPPDAAPVNVDLGPLTLGVTNPADLGHESGKAARVFAAAAAARKRGDWAAVKRACEETIAADALHLEAHRLLASALAQQGEYEAALEQLKIALGGDWVRWGAAVERDPDLEPLASSALGAAFTELVAAHREQFARSARAGLLVVARRAPFKEPVRKKAGASARLSSRAEVFAYVAETQRYLRLTRTGFQVLGFLASPSGDEIAYVAASHVRLAEPAGAPPRLATAQVGVVNLSRPEAVGPAATIKDARVLAIEYLAGDELVATRYDPAGTWGLGQAHPLTIDRSDGTARPTKAPEPSEPGRRLLVRYETVALETAGEPDGVAADWNPETGGAEEFVIESSHKRVQLRSGDAAARSSFAWSPDRSRLAFATVADPCAPLEVDRQASLYLVDAESGRLRHIYRGATRFLPRFLGAGTLAFEDEGGAVRLYDAAIGREVGRLETRGGVAFVGLGALAGPVCMSEPAPPAQPAPSASSREDAVDAK